MANEISSLFSPAFPKNVPSNTQTQSSQESVSINQAPTIALPTSTNLASKSPINKDNVPSNPIVTSGDYTTVTSLEISNQDAKKLSANIDKVEDSNGKQVTFSDEWSRKNEKFDSQVYVDKVKISDLLYQDPNVLYDEITKAISFTDSTMGTDSIALSKLTGDVALIQLVDKINTFGKIYDFQFKEANFGEYKQANTSLCSSVANALGYLSFDKLLNDEVIRKTKIDALNAQDPRVNPAYSGFLVSPDYVAGGWINIDTLAVNDFGFLDETLALSVRTKKIKEAKRILIKLILNFSSSIVELHSQNKLVDFGIRVKDNTTGQIFDIQNIINGNINCVGNQVALSYSGKIDYGDVTAANPALVCDPNTKIIQAKCTNVITKVSNCTSQETVEGLSHEIMPQIRINPLIGVRQINSDFTNTIDPINWTTGIQNIPDYKNVFKDLISEWGEGEYLVGHLNVPRSFAYAGGSESSAYICGGFFNSVLKENVSSSLPNNFNNTNAWGLIGNNSVYYEIATPGGYSYNITNAFVLNYEEEFDGTNWHIVNNTVIPTPKAMGLAGGGKPNESKIIGFGVYDAEFLNNGTVKSLYPTSQVWVKDRDLWTHLNNGNYSRVCPSGYIRSVTINSSGDALTNGSCSNTSTPPVVPKDFFFADSNPNGFPEGETLSIDPATQIKLNAAMNQLLGNTSAKNVNTNAANTVGIVFNGWIGAGGNTVSTGLGSPSPYNQNPFGLDKIRESDITNIFEYIQEIKVDFATTPPSLNPAPPSVESTVSSTFGWFVDTNRNYPIKTMGTLYLGNEISGIATGGKTSVSVNEQDAINTISNIKYSYFNDSRYSEFNNSIVNLVYEYNCSGWIRRDNLAEAIAFHTGVGDVDHQIIYGGLHGTVEKSDISVSFPGCDHWEQMIANFGGTWHRKGTTGLDREKRYASFSTIHEDAYKNTYFKVGDFRDINKDGIIYSQTFLNTGSLPDLSGVNWPTYVNPLSGHLTQIAYNGNNSQYTNLLDITQFVGGESWVSGAIKYEMLSGNNPTLPYAERESALDDTDQVGYITKNYLSVDAFRYDESYKPDYRANPLMSADGIASFPISGYFASKDNYKSIIDKYKYAGHPTDGGMWLWSRPTPGEELFHPTNIFDNPQYYFDSCGVKHISGTWQTYDTWIGQSFKTNIGLHSAICWYNKSDCVTIQDSVEEQTQKFAVDTTTTRNYRWTMGDFRNKANRLSPLGKQLGCLDVNVASDREFLYSNGYISICDFVSGNIPNTALSEGTSASIKYAWDVKNAFRRITLCTSLLPVPHYVGYYDNGTSIQEIAIFGSVVEKSYALTISPSASWPNYFDYVYENIGVSTSPISGVFFKNGSVHESGVGYPLQVDYNSDFFTNNSVYCGSPITVNPTGDFVGYDSKCFSPIDYFNQIWFIPTVPVSSCCLSGCDFLAGTPFASGSPLDFVSFVHQISGGCKSVSGADYFIQVIDDRAITSIPNIFSNKFVSIPTSICVSANGINYGCASTSGCVYLNPCGLYIADCSCLTPFTSGTSGVSANPIVFYHTGWFDDRVDAMYGCTKPDGFQYLVSHEPCENSCLTWWTSGCHIFTHPVSGTGFYWIHGNNAAYLQKDFGYYPNNFSITGCGLHTCTFGLKDPTSSWNFVLPETSDINRINHLRELYDTLSFGLPETYVIPNKFTYSFYITRDGAGLDQLFYGRSRNKFVERWKFPHRDTILNTFDYNKSKPYTEKNDGTGEFESLEDSSLFKYGSISVGEMVYPTIYEDIIGNVDASALFNSIVLMSTVQADISSSRVANYFTTTFTNQVTASCDFTSLNTWLNTKVDTSVKEKYLSHYCPMTYDNFSGPISGGPYFLPRGKAHQSQFSIIPTANSSSIRDRASLWPWCDLLQGKSTNKPTVGDATWYWDVNGNIWTAETIAIETITPTFCTDQNSNTDLLHRKLSPSTIQELYPTSYERETYEIKCQDKKGNLLVDYKISYDEVAGPELIGSKEGFDYNIFGTALKPRSIDLVNYNNKPLNGPTQTWVEDYDEGNSIHAIDWRRTQLIGSSGCPMDLYPYNMGTVCDLLSGGYYKHNIKNALGYFCQVESGKDMWVYSAPTGDISLSVNNSNFFIQESPFAIKKKLSGSAIGMTTSTASLSGVGQCLIDGFPPLSAICYSVSSAPSACCYMPGVSGQCISFDIETAQYTYDANVCMLYVAETASITSSSISGNTPCAITHFLSPSSVPLSAIGFFSFGQVPPIGYVAPYKALGWINCQQLSTSFGSEIVQSVRYNNGNVNGGLVSSAYITSPNSFGLGGLGFGKSTGLCGSLLYVGNRASCQFSPFDLTQNGAKPQDNNIRKAWPWNVLGFDGLLGPTGYTDALDENGNYWLAIGDINNTNPFTDTGFVSFEQNKFKNFYTIVKVDATKKSEFFKTVLGKTNWKEVDGKNLSSIICLSQSYDLVAETVDGTRYREGIMEALNMIEGQKYYDLYVTLIQENSTNVNQDSVIMDKVNYTPIASSSGQVSGAFILPIEPLDVNPQVKVIQKLDIVSQFDINCTNSNFCYSTFLTDCPSAANWKQHNHEEWIAPYLESPFAGPYSEAGFNIWLTAGGEPRWGVSLWSSIKEGKVWANYRRQRIHVNEYRNQLVLASLTAAVAIDDFEAISTSAYNVSGSNSNTPVYINYDEFIYCLDSYRDSKFVIDVLSKETQFSTNGVDCTDSIVASINNFASIADTNIIVQDVSGSLCTIITTPCSAFNLTALKDTSEGYVEWATSFIQEYRSLDLTKPINKDKYYFKYNLNTNMDSNTFIDPACIISNDIIQTQWRRYQDGVGLGGDAPSFNLFDNNTEFTCNRLNQWFIGQSCVGTTSKAIIVGGYTIAGDGELHRSHAWWESNTIGVTFKWNPYVIQPEDTSNMNYKYRTLSPFWSNGDNAGVKSTMGVTLFDVGSSTKVERQGSAKFENNITTYAVLFDTVIPDYLPNKDKYSISLVCSDNVKLWWTDKTATGFTINAETTFSGYVDWSIYLEDTIPGATVDAIDEQSTFEIFDSL